MRLYAAILDLCSLWVIGLCVSSIYFCVISMGIRGILRNERFTLTVSFTLAMWEWWPPFAICKGYMRYAVFPGVIVEMEKP